MGIYSSYTWASRWPLYMGSHIHQHWWQGTIPHKKNNSHWSEWKIHQRGWSWMIVFLLKVSQIWTPLYLLEWIGYSFIVGINWIQRTHTRLSIPGPPISWNYRIFVFEFCYHWTSVLCSFPHLHAAICSRGMTDNSLPHSTQLNGPESTWNQLC